MQVIVSGHLGMKINYMVVDLVVTMLSWHHMAIPAVSVHTALPDFLIGC